MKRLLIALLLLNLIYLIAHQFFGSESADSSAAGVGAAGDGAAGDGVRSLNVSAPTISASTVPAPALSVQSLVAGDFGTSEASDEVDSPPKTGALASSPDASAATSAEQAPAAESAQQSVCLVLGPFRRDRDATEVLANIRLFINSADVRVRESKILPDYLVHVGPEEDLEAARSRVAAFAAAGVDSQLIRSGALQNAVSLGVYSRKPLANALIEQLQNAGFQPKLRALFVNRKGYQISGSFRPGIRNRLADLDQPFVDCPEG